MKSEVLSDTVTLYYGDCRDILHGLNHIDVVVTDPPYGLSFQSNYRLEKWGAIENDHNYDCLQFAARLNPLHSAYIFARWDNLLTVPRPQSCITWVKNNWSMGDLEHEHARQTEIILFYPGPKHAFPRGRPTDVLRVGRVRNDDHPTEKPMQLMRAIIEWTTGVVCDPFMGSGTTGCAAVDIGRSFIGIEIDQAYFDKACVRISAALRQPRMQFFREHVSELRQTDFALSTQQKGPAMPDGAP